jgi:hypothetical protein
MMDEYVDAKNTQQAWNSKEFEDIRTAFREGKKHPLCSTCWREESASGFSPRLGYSAQHRTLGHAEDYKADAIHSVQWSFGNTCNFACRTCSLELSTGWLRETRMQAQEGNRDAQILLEHHTKTQFDYDQWDEIKPILPTVNHLELIGGETLINPRLPSVLEELADTHAHHITLRITTNGSVGPRPQLTDALSKFKGVCITFSIDAVTEDLFSYVRTGSWPTVSANIDKWMEDKRFEYQANCTWSILNVWDCDRIMRHLDKRFNWDHVGWNWVQQPPCYNACNLPDHIKQQLETESTYWRSKPVLANLWRQTRSESQWQEFIQRTEWLDQSRSQPLEKFVPKLSEIIHT